MICLCVVLGIAVLKSTVWTVAQERMIGGFWAGRMCVLTAQLMLACSRGVRSKRPAGCVQFVRGVRQQSRFGRSLERSSQASSAGGPSQLQAPPLRCPAAIKLLTLGCTLLVTSARVH